jgi:hypothetical protein
MSKKTRIRKDATLRITPDILIAKIQHSNNGPINPEVLASDFEIIHSQIINSGSNFDAAQSLSLKDSK